MLAERIGQAIRARAPDANKTGWRAECADRLDVHEETFANWYYGKSAPTGEGLIALFGLFGPAFVTEILAPLGLHVSCEATDAVHRDKLARIAAIIAEPDGGR